MSSQTSILKKSLQIALQNVVSVHHADGFTAHFLCFRRFPAAPSQLKTPARMKKHSRTVLRKNPLVAAQQDDIFLTKTPSSLGRTMARRMQIWPANENTIKTLARQKTDIGFQSHPIVWRRSTTKGSVQLRQKNVSGKHTNVGMNTTEIAALHKTKPLEKAWN